MNLLETLVLNVILILFPLLLYLFYTAYQGSDGKKENLLFLDCALVTSLYLTIRFGSSLFGSLPILAFNTPLILAYAKKRKATILILSAMIVVYYWQILQFNLWFILIEYITYYVVYFLFCKKKNEWETYVDTFIIMKSFWFSFWAFSSSYFTGATLTIFVKVFLLISIIYIITYFAILLFEKGEDVMQLHMSIKQLEQEKQIRNSLFKITHEIKNPIAVCKGYLDMFDVKNENHSKKYIPIMKEEIERVLLLLQDFLSMTKINITKEIMDVNMMLDELTENLEPWLQKRNIMIDMNIPDEELYIKGDYNRLSQVMLNVIKNSIEAIVDDQAGYIKVYTKETEKKVHIFVEDNGIGMDSLQLNKISEPFYTTKSNGTGLGVSFSTEIIKAHNGIIRYQSEKGMGTKVTIILDK